jgi:predicted glycogen debranching enzyme
MSSITIDNLDLIRSPAALTCEWLETNGTGGYSSSSILQCHTRKYHGLLVANLTQPSGRYVLLSKVEDSIAVGERESFLVSHQYPGYYFTGGQSFLRRFNGGTRPKFTYEIEDLSLEKEILMIRGMDSVILKYRLQKFDAPCILRLKPFFAYRSIHSLSAENTYFRGDITELQDGYRMTPYEGMPAMHIQLSSPSRFLPGGVWYKRFEYAEEKARGYDYQEDLYCPGVIEIPFDKKKEIYVGFSTEPFSDVLKKIWTKEQKKRVVAEERNDLLVEAFREEKESIKSLLKAADQLLVRTPTGRNAILAGYHWFYEWGRDTLISLPGLTFCRQCFQEGQEILKTFGEFEKYGLFPNFFAEDEKENAYNTVDASLWYFWAVQQYLKYGGDDHFVQQYLWPVMKRILKQFMAGTIYDIYMDDRGLLHAGSEGTRLSWMDAAVDGLPVTPRWGYMVEINALWHNAVCFSQDLALKYDDQEFVLTDLIPLIRQSFRNTFWTNQGSYLGDVWRQGVLNDAVRPNQIFAVSLPYSPLEPSDWIGVVDKVQSLLLTPCGLRTLAPGDPDYRGRYEGAMTERDGAYHQGTVWPWLWGHFGEAYLRVHHNSKKAKSFLQKQIRIFLKNHLPQAGMGCISEVFDGDPPHRPNGCISQAWSTAELIRLLTLLKEIR